MSNRITEAPILPNRCCTQPILGRVHHSDWLNNGLPDKCAKLIIADPPYFEVKGDFDFVWKSFEDYLIDVEKWAVECKRVLADNGTLFWYGNSKKIAYTQIILDKYFNLENSLIWRKKDSIQYQYYSPDLARTFNTHNERLLMYSAKIFDNGNPFAEYLKYKMKYYSIKTREIQELFPSKTGGLTGCVSNWLNGDNVMTEQQYVTVQNKYGKHIFDKGYKTLIDEYEKSRRFFYNPNKYEEVLEFSQEGHKTGKYDHDTCKPETLTRALILTCSRPNDLVVVPFAGSGTEVAMAIKENRQAIGFDVEEKYCQMSNDRIKKVLSIPDLFA
jgi:site-specific DNA-methyltransferase (adenine-specific)